MLAPERFAIWLASNKHVDRRWGHTYLYHSRSDAHSIALCQFIRDDLVNRSELLRLHAGNGVVGYGINRRMRFPNGKEKAIDLAIGVPEHPADPVAEGAIPLVARISRLLVACEAKAVMTEHSKAKPRVYDELSSSHEIVHQGQPDAIAAGVCVVNLAGEFVSPLRQTSVDAVIVSTHAQPRVTAEVVQHLRGLPIRDTPGQVGFDAFTTIVIETDNRTFARHVATPPAPQPGDKDHYQTFLERIARLYLARFATL